MGGGKRYSPKAYFCCNPAAMSPWRLTTYKKQARAATARAPNGAAARTGQEWQGHGRAMAAPNVQNNTNAITNPVRITMTSHD